VCWTEVQKWVTGAFIGATLIAAGAPVLAQLRVVPINRRGAPIAQTTERQTYGLPVAHVAKAVEQVVAYHWTPGRTAPGKGMAVVSFYPTRNPKTTVAPELRVVCLLTKDGRTEVRTERPRDTGDLSPLDLDRITSMFQWELTKKLHGIIEVAPGG
jgi:hypothetical protein